ncbi:MAG: ATP-binding protein [Bacteroidota bacterium]|nr:ATP-binding protein [Bacteroidota bacterium]
MSTNKWNINRTVFYLRRILKFRRDLPPGLEKEFTEYKDIESIERIKVGAWIGLMVSVLLFPLDISRMLSGQFEEQETFRLLFYFHIFGLIYILPVWSMTFHKKWVVSTRLRRGIHIWGMVVITFIFLFGMAILVFISRNGLVMFFAFIFICSWMFAMSFKELMIFYLFTLPPMVLVVYLKKEVPENYPKIAIYYEIVFLSLVTFFFDAFDYNLRVTNFLALKEIKQDQHKIKRLEQFKSRFFTNLTHELRTPLTVISGMSEVIKENPKRWLDEGSEIITRNAGNLLNLINQILDLSKLENGSLPVNMVHGDIISYIGYVIDAFRGHAETEKITLHFLCEEEEILMDYDPDKYFSIISNLLSNAIRFTPEEGNIYIQITPRNIDNKAMLEIIVRDTGKGIPEEDLTHIFERFFQSDDTGKNFGTGIGLSIVHELVRVLEGEIKVRSTLGKGTQFVITLPQYSVADMVNTDLFKSKINKIVPGYITPPELIEETDTGTDSIDLPEVLIVEDNVDVIKFLEVCLGDTFHLTFRKDGQSGIDKAIESVPDIIISDVMMPVKDGLALCRELKELEITSHIPIILLSARTDTPSRIAGLESGADLYLAKPFDKKELRLQITNMLDSRQELQERYGQKGLAPVSNEDTGKKREDEFVGRVRDIVYQHLDDSEFGIHELCRSIYLSRTQVHKKLKALTGLSASLFIRQIRLLAAREMLQTHELNVTEVAYKVGFTDPNYFSRCFAQEFGISPSDSRK